MSAKRPRTTTIAFSVRTSRDLHARASRLSKRPGPYTPSLSQMVERGLELAVAEQEGTLRINGDTTAVPNVESSSVKMFGVLVPLKRSA